MSIGSRIALLREERKLSQFDLSQKLSLGQSTIAMYEKDNRKPDPAMIVKIANFFNVTTDYLLGNSDTRHSNMSNNPNNSLIAPLAEIYDDLSPEAQAELLKLAKMVKLVDQSNEPDTLEILEKKA